MPWIAPGARSLQHFVLMLWCKFDPHGCNRFFLNDALSIVLPSAVTLIDDYIFLNLERTVPLLLLSPLTVKSIIGNLPNEYRSLSQNTGNVLFACEPTKSAHGRPFVDVELFEIRRAGASCVPTHGIHAVAFFVEQAFVADELFWNISRQRFHQDSTLFEKG